MGDLVWRYVPALMWGNDTMERIYAVAAEELEKCRDAMRAVLDRCWIGKSDSVGVAQWENLLGIGAGGNLAERKDYARSVLQFKPPLTYMVLKRMLDNIWGAGEYVLELNYDALEITVDVDVKDIDTYKAFIKRMNETIPANIEFSVKMPFTHIFLGRELLNYGEISEYTYGELSQFAEQFEGD